MGFSARIKAAHLKRGAFTAEAKAHGKSVGAFASFVDAHPDEFSARTKRRANLAQTFRKLAKKR